MYRSEQGPKENGEGTKNENKHSKNNSVYYTIKESWGLQVTGTAESKCPTSSDQTVVRVE